MSSLSGRVKHSKSALLDAILHLKGKHFKIEKDSSALLKSKEIHSSLHSLVPATSFLNSSTTSLLLNPKPQHSPTSSFPHKPPHTNLSHHPSKSPNQSTKMPKGQRLIDWTPVNDARLILTIMAVEDLHPNCDAVAKAFGEHSNLNIFSISHFTKNNTGGNVNAMSISNRLSRLRRQAASEGLVPEGVAKAITKGRKGAGGAGKKRNGSVTAEGSG